MSVDPVITRARERLRLLRTECAELERFLLTYERLSAHEQGGSDQSESDGPAEPQGRQSIVTAAALDAADLALKENGAPMKLGALFNAVLAKGIVVSGKNPVNNFGAMLSYSDRFETKRGRGWWFKETPSLDSQQVNGAGHAPKG